ncbi:MAG: dUTP diphosphatase, partial [Ureaplasma sp.]|nr:dUTP diphosphatase [Ureaplasma sp.]
MLKIQSDLNEVIQETQNISRDKTRIQSHLCIMIELMELCNSTRCFNYWSMKKRQDDDDVLEEFSDVLCFLLTELLELSINEINFNETIKQENNLELTIRFQELVKLYNELNYKDGNT